MINIKRWINRTFARCELCRGKLRKHGDKYYGGIEVKDAIGDKKPRTASVCNLCYQSYYRKN